MNRSKVDTNNYRYERKFFISSLTRSKVEALIKIHPAMFKEIFHLRPVNNLYLDTHDLDSYFHNFDGSAERFKVRIRWYGELFGHVASPMLEIKSKKGLLGKKVSYPLKSFNIEKGFSTANVRNILKQSDIPELLREKLLGLEPILLNQYKRKYFQSADKHFRTTIDSKLIYYKISAGRNLFTHKHKENNSVIMEIKYAHKNDIHAQKITSFFPFEVTKSSKYVDGISKLDLW